MKPAILAGIALAAFLATNACGTDDGVEGETTLPVADTVSTTPSRARRDSAVAGSQLPGAGVVRGAMEAAEVAGRRTATSDSLAE